MAKILNSETKESLTAKFYKMATIPPKGFYKLSKEQQWSESVKKFQYYQELAEEWRKISVICAKKHISEPEIDRPDLITLKD